MIKPKTTYLMIEYTKSGDVTPEFVGVFSTIDKAHFGVKYHAYEDVERPEDKINPGMYEYKLGDFNQARQTKDLFRRRDYETEWGLLGTYAYWSITIDQHDE
jgi:hypothetical protein